MSHYRACTRDKTVRTLCAENLYDSSATCTNSSHRRQSSNAREYMIPENIERFFLAGYYRVNYNDANWELLANYLNSDKFEELPPVTRAQLLDDSLNLARAGYLTYTTALKLTLYLDKENDYIPWYTVARNFDYIDHMLQNMSNYDTLQVGQIRARRMHLVAFVINRIDREIRHPSENQRLWVQLWSFAESFRNTSPRR